VRLALRSSRSHRITGFVLALSWTTALSALIVVSASATGATDHCVARRGYAPVSPAFWSLLISSVALSALGIAVYPRRTLAWLSAAAVVVAALISLIVFGLGYGCGNF
jgi:Trk-type K+ transport system membrane component